MENAYKIEADHVSKAFRMYDTPMDKLKEALSIDKKVLHTDFYAVTDLSFSVKKARFLELWAEMALVSPRC